MAISAYHLQNSIKNDLGRGTNPRSFFVVTIHPKMYNIYKKVWLFCLFAIYIYWCIIKTDKTKEGYAMRLKNIDVEVTGIYSYTAKSFGYGYETKYIYTMRGADDTVYAWKNTTALLGFDEVTNSENEYYSINAKGEKLKWNQIHKGDVITISATVKGEDEYNGQKQTLVNRVKVHGRTFKAKTPEEIEAEKMEKKEREKREQMDSIKEGDIVQKMPYRQYKEHYNDCETVIDSYECDHGKSTIKVIIRKGRLKNSGVRGEHFNEYQFFFEYEGQEISESFRAVSEENALKQLSRQFKKATNIKAGNIW